MRSQAFGLLLSGAIGLLVTGCASATPEFRGQSPQMMQTAWEGGGHGGHNCPMCQHGMGHGVMAPGAGYCDPQCQAGPGCNLPFHPVHRNFYTYSTPSNLMYPPENSQPAQVQYPYYTLRGPTDFFME
ncbi:MAG: hypothetical protein KDA85_15115 [Planctomycetaceae bacterium]|nr:hypothetical protein [Planctomycetaceae bacterium]